MTFRNKKIFIYNISKFVFCRSAILELLHIKTDIKVFRMYVVKHTSLKAVCTSLARRDYTTQNGHWQVAISSTQLSINIRKRGSWGTNGHWLGIVLYIEGASSYK